MTVNIVKFQLVACTLNKNIMLQCGDACTYTYSFIQFLASLLSQHEKICQFPSENFYNGVLRTRLTDYWRSTGELPESAWPSGAPFVFWHVEGLEESQSIATVDGNEQSKWNKKDAFETVISATDHHRY